MARFLSEYKEIDTRPSWEKTTATVTLILLFLLVPTTVLGYYSESSLPGQPLYVMKRGIESMVLLVESFSPDKKSLYYQTLATNRIRETSTIITQAEASGSDFSSSDASANDIAINLSEVVTSVKQASQETKTISNPSQKQQAQQQLASSIKSYQQQLTEINYTIQEHLITPTPTQASADTAQQTSQPTDTPTPTQTQNSNSTSNTNLQNDIQQTQDQLQNIIDNLQTNSATPSSQGITATPIPTPSPTPTVTPTPTPTPTNDKHKNWFDFFHDH